MTIIKRYSNRKLYDSEAARYVTLDELGDRIHQGEDISVVDHESGADLTALTLMQIMFEREKKVGGMLPKAILTTLIQAGTVAVDTLRSGINALVENTPAMETEIRRRLSVLAEDGQVAVEEAQRMTELLISNRWKQRETSATNDPQPAAEQPVVVDVAPVIEEPFVAPGATIYPTELAPAATPGEVDRLQQQIADLERQIAAMKSARREG